MQDEGFVAALLFPSGTSDIPLGTIIAIIVEDKSQIAAFANYSPADISEEAEPEVAAPVKAEPE
jgi:pyruvate dehydrogenase E2 component (dihydrolipoamide acetyltransferase)